MTPIDPVALAEHYQRFRVGERVLLTGHSHQAWPDVAEEGTLAALADAAEHVSSKWERAFEKAERVRRGYRTLLGAPADSLIALAENGHGLLVRLLSALPLRHKPRIVTTRVEFLSAFRQLRRLEEEGVDVCWVPEEPFTTLADRVAEEVSGDTALVVISSVTYQRGLLVEGLPELTSQCRRFSVPILIDAYHHLGAVPFSISEFGDAFVLGGGNKYLQLGEGVAFMRVPEWAVELRPAVTGWFADAPDKGERVGYADGPDRWTGATYDVTSHYRAARVLDFFDDHRLSPERLRALNLRQVARLRDAIDPGLLRDDVPPELRGGFLALRCRSAPRWVDALRAEGVWTNARGDVLRLGPAPYVSDAQLDRAAAAVGVLHRE